MHDTMAYSDRRTMQVILKCFPQSAKGIFLRFENAVALHQRLPIKRANVQRAIASANALGPSGEHRIFVVRAAAIDAKL
jgi:hypothetical protein